MEFRILGPVEIWRDGRPVRVIGEKQRSLLAVLVLNANQVVSHDRLVAALWGVDAPPTARRLLHKHVWSLRRLISGPDALSGTPAGYRLRVEPGCSDLDVFTTRAGEARVALAAGDTPRAAECLRAALALWRGPALGGTHGYLRLAESARLEERRLAALADRIQADLELGRHAELVGELRGLVVEHPAWERLRGQLMLALHHAGRTAEALEEYRDARRYLRDELGLEPGEELIRLHQVVLAAIPQEPAEAASSGRSRATPRQLPSDIASFTGRAAEVEVLTLALERRGGPATVVISAIAGTAGVGKTALAVHWAWQVAGRFPDGQLYVDLRGYSAEERLDAGQVLRRFLGALGVEPEAVPHDPDEQATVYRSLLAGRRVLVVLDNAGGSDQVRPLLPGSPGCFVLVTSRDDLRGLLVTHDAQAIGLGALPREDAGALLARLLGDARCAAEPAAVAELARLCGYLPLALRIAAAHLAANPRLSITAMAGRLGGRDRLGALAIEGDPQLAIRAALEPSYQALALEERRIFRLLGAHPGQEISVQAAAVLGDMTPALASLMLNRLASAHLVERHRSDRFGFHDLVREYARERTLAEDLLADRRAAADRLYEWYLHRVDAAARLLTPQLLRLPVAGAPSPPFAGTGDALDWLDMERANLLAAIVAGPALGAAEPAWLIADAIRGYFSVRSDTVDWLVAARAALAAAEAAGDDRARAAAHHSLAQAYYCRGEARTATDHLALALEFSERADWGEGEATALGNLGNVLADAGRLEEAAAHIGRAIAKYGEIGNQTRMAIYLGNLGGVLTSTGRLADAVRRHRQALTLFRQEGAVAAQALALNNVGYVLQLLGHLDESISHLTEALAVYRSTDRINGQAICLGNLAMAYADAGRYDTALDHARRAVELIRETDDRYVEAEVLITLGSAERHVGRYDDANRHHGEALRIAREISAREHAVGALLGLAAVHLDLSETDLAMTRGWEAFRLAEECGYPLPMGQALATLAAGCLPGEPGRAAELAERALELLRPTGNRLGVARALITLGRARLRTGDAAGATALRREALDLLAEIGAPEPEHQPEDAHSPM